MRWYQRTLPGWYDYQYKPGTDHQCCLVTVSKPDLGPGLGPQTADLELALDLESDPDPDLGLLARTGHGPQTCFV